MKRPILSVVVPLFNEEEVIEELLRRLKLACTASAGENYEIVLVDDGSRDKTRDIIRVAQSNDDRLVVVILSRNHGHQLALSAGLFVAQGERILIIDADLQDPPELLSPMMSLMDEGFDVVYGVRMSRLGESAFKIWSANLFYRLLKNIINIDIPVDAGDFRLISDRVKDLLVAMPEQDRFVRGMISWIGFRQIPIQYNRDKRFAGETKYPFRKMLLFALDAITGFSILPLRIATYAGFVISCFSLIFGVYALFSWFYGNTVSGWTSLTIIILLIGGSQMIMIGVIGEYIGRLFRQSKSRPLFIIDELLGNTHDVSHKKGS